LKIIAISQRVDEYPDRAEARDSLDQQLTSFVATCGAILIPVPNLLHKHHILLPWLHSVSPTGIILSGGDDIGMFVERDATEETLLTYSETLGLPLLGICRGAQVISSRAGSKIKRVEGHVAVRHRIRGEINGEVNSFHNNVIADKPNNFSIIARSPDNEIEAIRHDHLPWEGWMWHPEREKKFALRDINRFRALIS
jgi:gamma-glutamyl-gamma-aminobutyrate hydrolase PuuD